jgi:peptidyl-prolyl cis-trans isomerase SDCCAG10
MWLNNKHTIFAKIEGDTIFNVINIGEVETQDDRPICEKIPTILRALVIDNPFEDIIPRNIFKGELNKEVV